ncbi:MAG: hypothetical protein RIQ47_592 [Bacteroidota bacterium]
MRLLCVVVINNPPIAFLNNNCSLRISGRLVLLPAAFFVHFVFSVTVLLPATLLYLDKMKTKLFLLLLLSAAAHAQSGFNSPAFQHIDTKDDAVARARWEIQRLADPATGKIPAGMRNEELEFATQLPKSNPSNSVARTFSTINERGPWNLGGRTRAIAVDITDENILLAGSVNGGMWRSTDGGATWTRVSPAGQNPAVTSIVQDTRPGRTNNWYYTTGEGYGASSSGSGAYYLGNGLYRSTDGGITWSVVTSSSSNTPHTFDNVWDLGWRVALDPSDTINNVIYVATYGAIFRSVNGGTSWTVDRGNNSGSTFSYFTDVAVTPEGVVYATLSSDGPSKGIWRKDKVLGWAKITPADLDTATFDRLVIGINPSNSNEVYFLGLTPLHGKRTTNYKGDEEWNSLLKYTYISGNGTGAGGQWEDLSINLPQDSTSQLGNFNAQGGYNLLVRVHPSDPQVVYVGGTNLYRSTDGFTSDSNVVLIGGYDPVSTIPFYGNYPNNHSDQHDLFFYPSNPDRMLQANDGGVYRTENNRATTVTWDSLCAGYLTGQFYTVALDHGQVANDIVIGGTQDNGTWYTASSDLLTPWAHPGFGDGGYCAIEDGHAYYYMSRQEGRVARYQLDSAGNVLAFRRIDPIGGDNYLFISPFALDPNNNNRMYLPAGSRLWRNDSLDIIPLTGQWDTLSTGWFQFPDSVSGFKISAVAVCKTPANRVYYGYNNRRIFRMDNADSATPVVTEITGTSVFPTSANISCIAVDPNNGDHVVVSFSNYRVYSIYATNDAGVTWTKVAGNLEASSAGTGAGPSVRWISIVPATSGNIYLAATSVGLYATNNLNGLNTIWTDIAANEIGYTVVDMMDVRTSDGLVAIATHGRGMFSMYVTDSLFAGISRPDPFALKVLAYPNPSNGNFTVRYSLQSHQQLRLTLVDQQGKIVKVLQDEYKTIGDHQLVINESLAPGVYYLVLEGSITGKYTQKLLVGGKE